MQEDGPLLPREFERALQLVYVLHQAEAALRVWVGEGVRAGGRLHRPVRRAAGRELQKRFRRLGRQVVGEVEQRVLIHAAHVVQPFVGDPVAHQRVIGGAGKERGLGRRRSGGRRVHSRNAGNFDLPHRLVDLDELSRAGLRMPLDPPPFRPSVRRVVMADIDEHDA